MPGKWLLNDVNSTYNESVEKRTILKSILVVC
jgi:hypothetical protein